MGCVNITGSSSSMHYHGYAMHWQCRILPIIVLTITGVMACFFIHYSWFIQNQVIATISGSNGTWYECTLNNYREYNATTNSYAKYGLNCTTPDGQVLIQSPSCEHLGDLNSDANVLCGGTICVMIFSFFLMVVEYMAISVETNEEGCTSRNLTTGNCGLQFTFFYVLSSALFILECAWEYPTVHDIIQKSLSSPYHISEINLPIYVIYNIARWLSVAYCITQLLLRYCELPARMLGGY